jgi:3-hydroxybutyryl-CoA dehydratase
MVEKAKTLLEKLGVDVGYKTSHVKTISESDIDGFADISGDFNPVHMSEEYAQQTVFSGRIAHGVIAVALLSAAIAKLPGLVILLSNSSRFLKPVRIGDTITALAEVTNTRKKSGIITLKSTCTNQNGKAVVESETTVRLYEAPA